MRSPSHITNIEPDIRMRVDTRLNTKPLHPRLRTATKASAGICECTEARYAGAWMQMTMIVRTRVI